MTGLYWIDTMGCQMNERDSETIAGLLEGLGLSPAASADEAAVVVLNTCAVREKPEHKVFSKLGDFGKLKRRRPELFVVVAGCVAQVSHEEIVRRAPYVDFVVGPRNLSALQEALQAHHDRTQVEANDAEIIPEGLAFRRTEGLGAFVNVSYGCDNFCTYCIVPYARGREQSRPAEAVVQEVREAVAAGYREVTLLGQNVNSYRGGVDFAGLLERVAQVAGLWRVRFTTSHPKDCSPRLLDAMRDLPPVCEHLHLPVQAGDDEVLARMGRGYTAAQYLALVEAARERMPGLALTTDVMVGFPGETEAQFERTLELFAGVRFDQAFMFKYSDREGTVAASDPDKVPETEKQRRLEALVELQNRLSREVNRGQEGQVFEVLVEGPDPKRPEKLRGRTRGNKLMVFALAGDPAALVGQLVEVVAERGYLWGFTSTAGASRGQEPAPTVDGAARSGCSGG